MNPEQRAQVFCTECHKSMAVLVPVPEFCECVHCKKSFPAGGETAPKTPPPPRITADEPQREAGKIAESNEKSQSAAGNSKPEQSVPPVGVAPAGAATAGSAGASPNQMRKVFAVAAAFVLVATASFLGGALTGSSSEGSQEERSEDARTTGVASDCKEKLALVSRTGKFQGAKLRAEPDLSIHRQVS